jgi:hypothetical protein
MSFGLRSVQITPLFELQERCPRERASDRNGEDNNQQNPKQGGILHLHAKGISHFKRIKMTQDGETIMLAHTGTIHHFLKIVIISLSVANCSYYAVNSFSFNDVISKSLL